MTRANEPSLAQLIEHERVELMQIHAMLRCLNDVLLYSDDDNASMHADVAKLTARLLDESIARLEGLRGRAAAAAAYAPPEVPMAPPHQVKERLPTYLC